jgi:hypothetical protein
VRAELRGIQEERVRIKGLQDEAYGRIVGARNQARDKSRVWGDNRWASHKQVASRLSLASSRAKNELRRHAISPGCGATTGGSHKRLPSCPPSPSSH